MDSWESCALDDIQLVELSKLEHKLFEREIVDANNFDFTQKPQNDVLLSTSDSIDDKSQIIKNTISKSESSCHNFLYKIDEVLQLLSELSASYFDVTGRTNILMQSCEELLEQQVGIV